MNLIDLARTFETEAEARAFIERLRWPDGPVCPHCGGAAYCLTPKPGSKRPVRAGVKKCRSCRRQFTVTVGTIFEDSHIPLNKWLCSIYLMASSKKGMSAHQLHRSVGVSYKSAWFMCHRIREAMKDPVLASKLGGIVEVDETYMKASKIKPKVGRPRKTDKPGYRKRGRGTVGKVVVTTLISRTGDARSFKVPNAQKRTLQRLIKQNVEDKAIIMTDSWGAYRSLEDDLGYIHESVDHSKEYVRGIIHTNFAESFFGLLKRGILGTFHQVSEQHLPRYLAEFDFRWNRKNLSDGDRMLEALKGAEGKRLTFKPLKGAT